MRWRTAGRRGQNPEENTKEEKAEKERSDPGAAQQSRSGKDKGGSQKLAVAK